MRAQLDVEGLDERQLRFLTLLGARQAARKDAAAGMRRFWHSVALVMTERREEIEEDLEAMGRSLDECGGVGALVEDGQLSDPDVAGELAAALAAEWDRLDNPEARRRDQERLDRLLSDDGLGGDGDGSVS